MTMGVVVRGGLGLYFGGSASWRGEREREMGVKKDGCCRLFAGPRTGCVLNCADVEAVASPAFALRSLDRAGRQ